MGPFYFFILIIYLSHLVKYYFIWYLNAVFLGGFNRYMFDPMTFDPATSAHLYRQDAGDDRHRDADRATVAHELDEGGRLEEELRDEEVGAGVHLLLQVREVLLVARAVRVSIRVRCPQQQNK